MKKRVLSLLLAATMLLSLLPMTVFATGTSYAITNGTPESDKETNHGFITIDKTSAAEDETVTVTVAPSAGYQLKAGSLKVNDGAVTITCKGIGKYEFTMPKEDVAVTAEFEQIVLPYFFDFESDFIVAGWTNIDADGDGQDWITGTNNYGAAEWGVQGSCCAVSQSYENDGDQIFDADNWLFSPAITIPAGGATVSWYEQSQDADYPDFYEVYVSETNTEIDLSKMTKIFSGDAANPWTQRSAELEAAEYAGKTVYIAFRHLTYDQYFLEIDDFAVAPMASYTVTDGTTQDANGTIAIDKASAAKDETVTITVTPAEGYQLKSLKFNDGSDHDITKDQTSGNYQFTMPAKAVTVTAEFERIADTALIANALNGTYDRSVPGLMEITVDKALGIRNIKLLKDVDMGAENVTVAENVFLDLNHFSLTTTGKLTNNGVITLHQENADIVEDLLYEVPGNYATDEELKLPNDASPDYVIPAKTFMTSEVGTNPAYQELSFASGDDMLVWNKDVTAGVQLDVTYSLALGGNILGAKGDNVKPTKVTAINFALNNNIAIGGNNGEGEASLVVESIPADDLFPETVGTFTANGKKITLGKSGKLVISSNITFDESVLVSGVNGMTVAKTENKTDGTVTYFLETPHTNKSIKVDGKAATTKEAGFKSYYKCDCGKFFEDATCKVEITDLAKWKAEGGNGYIAKLEEDPKSPQTGDTSNMTLWIMLMALSSMGLCACLVLGKKRKNEQ